MHFCDVVMLLQSKKNFGNSENRLKTRAFCVKIIGESLGKNGL